MMSNPTTRAFPMRVHKGHFERLRGALAASVVTLLAAGSALAAQPAASGYKPTMADYLGVYDALQNYRFGVEKHDQKAMEHAFWEDGSNRSEERRVGKEGRS